MKEEYLPPPGKSWLDVLADLPEQDREEILQNLNEEEAKLFEQDWFLRARREQIEPPGDWWFFWLFCSGRGAGKQLRLSTPLPTPTGWTTMGEVQVGDQLIDEAGKPCTVTDKHYPETQICYKVTFSDGSVIYAGGDHQWVTWTYRDRKQYQRYEAVSEFPADWPNYEGLLYTSHHSIKGSFGPKVRTTEDIFQTLTIGKRGDTNHSIPTTSPIDLPKCDLPVDPWLLGYWLGNGTRGTGDVCSGSYNGSFDSEHVAEKLDFLAYSYTYKDNSHKGSGMFYIHGLLTKLRELGILTDPRIPSQYLRSSISQRVALLRGLMDSDGYPDKVVEFCSTDYGLAVDLNELVISLGEVTRFKEGRARLNGVDYGPKYRITWRPTQVNSFSLPRKAVCVPDRASQALRCRQRMIRDIEEIPKEQMACVSVDSPNKMYLAGGAMIPTHNTWSASNWIIDNHFRAGVKWSAIIAPTSNDIRKQCVEGPSGVCTVAPDWFRPEHVPSKNILRWPDGGQTDLISSDKPDRIRGGNYEIVWWDELSYSAHPDYLLDMVTMTLRIGERPRGLLTMTPRPIEAVKSLIEREGKDVVVTRGSTYDNRENLSRTFINQVIERYEGTTLGRQELEGALLADIEGALWTHALIDQQRLDAQPSRLNKVVIGVDPAATSGRSADETGIIAAGRNPGGNGFVLGDYSLRGTPQQWAMKAIEKYHWHEADYIVAESNQGGEMVREVIKNSDPTVPVKLVSASKGKFPRAQPIAHLYEQGRIFHCGTFRELEDEMAMFNPDELRKSPDRVDALVWAMTELMGVKKSRAGVWGSTRRAA